jgi:opacity protein-like surface antigen
MKALTALANLAITITLSLLPLTSTLAQASSAGSTLHPQTIKGWYAGGGITSSRVHSVASYGTYIDSSSKETGYIITGGYRLNPFLAFELGYLDSGEQNFTSDRGETDISLQTAEASGLLILPFGIFEVYGRLGIGLWEADSQQRWLPYDGNPGFNKNVSDDGTGFIIGFGLGVNLGDHWHLRTEVQDVSFDEELLTVDDNLDASLESWMIELQYRFGNNWQ